LNSANTIHPKLTLIGAGPGDPELISIKGVKTLAEADVILYDALVSKELLKYCRPSAIKIFVGKRKNKHAFTQEEINRKIVEMALKHGHVVRLKGGDPFVFGRGHEEIEFAECFDVEIEVVPGITSAIAVPELQGFPLTKRGVSESFFVTTGTTSSGEISKDIFYAAKSDATVVVLMGMHRLGEIVSIFKGEGKKDLPVAIIQNGTMPDEKIGLGNIEIIEEVVKQKDLGSPAIIVIGEVVRLHKDFPAEMELVNILKNKQ
jgi:uroporphyrin-III C-methyltransferase